VNVQNEIAVNPFKLISGQGLGYSEKSNHQEISAIESRTYGQAKLKYYANVATGNLIAKDRAIKIEEVGGPIELSYVYNSFSGWTFSQNSTLIVTDQTIKLKNAEGSESVFIKNADGNYYAPATNEGINYITIDKNTYTCHFPKSNHKEIYDDKGKLIKKINAKGNETQYEYDNDGLLKAIVAASGYRYEIRRDNQKITIVAVNNKKEETLLHTYVFENGNLQTSTTADGYKTQYYYQNGLLNLITQPDSSSITFGYDESNKVKTIQSGSDNINTFIYEKNKTIVQNALGVKTELILDTDNRISDIKKETDPVKDSKSNDDIHYEYNTNGQVEKISYSDKTFERFEYDKKSGLCNYHLKRDSTFKQNFYVNDEKLNISYLISSIESNENKTKQAKTRFIYEFKNNCAFLRFQISPNGLVKELTYNEKGLVENSITYPNVEDTYQKNEHPTLDEMIIWKNERDLRSVITTQEHNEQGRLIKSFNLENKNEELLTLYRYDTLGHITETKIKHSGQDEKSHKYIQTNRKFNDCGHLIEEIEALDSKNSQIKVIEFSENKKIITYPNKKVEAITYNSQHLINRITLKSSDTKEEQTSEIIRDTKENLLTYVASDKNKHLSYYDRQNRLAKTVSPEKAVTTIEYNNQYRFQKKIQYATPLDKDGNLVIDAMNDRTTYKIFNENEKIRYEIDAENYLTEYQYDFLGNLTGFIQYYDKLTGNEFNLITSNQDHKRIPDSKKDRAIKYFYDLDGNKIGEQDPAGYVTEFKRNAAGFLIEKIQYSKPNLSLSDDFEKVKPECDEKEDSHAYYFYNNLNQCTIEVDAEGYITTHSYYADGKEKYSIRFETGVDNWVNKKIPPVPTASVNDLVSHFHYDELGRLKEIKKTDNTITSYEYDNMNHRTATVFKDGRVQNNNFDSDSYRATKIEMNAWGQIASESSPLVMERIALSNTASRVMAPKPGIQSPGVMPGKAGIQQNTNNSLRHEYNEVGLKVKTTNELGRITYFYYDKDGNPVLSIREDGAVKESVFNLFGEELKHIKYYTPLKIDEKIKGGYISDEIKQKIMKDPKHDREVEYKRDSRGQISKKTDPEGNVSLFQYNAFNACNKETLPVNSKNPTLEIKHEFDTRGNEIKTTKTPINPRHSTLVDKHIVINNYFEEKQSPKSIVTEQKFEHFSNKLTEITKANGGKEKIKRDKLGRIKKHEKEIEKNQFSCESEFQYNAFSKVKTITDADNQTQTILYDQKKGTKTIISPLKNDDLNIKENIFGETIEKQIGNDFSESIRHGADGQVTVKKIGTSISSTEFNIMGQKEKEINPNGIIKENKYNLANHLKDINIDIDKKGLNLNIHYEPNLFGQNETEIDIYKRQVNKEFDKCGHLQKSIRDPNGRAIKTFYDYNAQGNTRASIQGDKDCENQLHQVNEHDDFNRSVAEIIDPPCEKLTTSALNIRSESKLDDEGHVIEEKDANGNIKRIFYDLLGRERFQLQAFTDGKCYATEKTYTRTGKIKGVRIYSNRVEENKFTTKSTLDDVKREFKEDLTNDIFSSFYYDEKGRERFHVTFLYDATMETYNAIIEEKQYDAADRVIKHIRYSKSILANNYLNWTTNTVSTLINPDSSKDRIELKWYNAESREQFIIDQNGIIIEKRYDGVGNIIAQIEYARPLENISFWGNKNTLELSLEIERNIKSPHDKITYQFYDSLNREIYHIAPNGCVTKKEYDNESKVKICRFNKAVTIESTDDKMLSIVNDLKPNPEVDSISDIYYDKTGAIYCSTDPLGKKEIFKRDASNNITTHTHKNQQDWNFVIDRANRLTHEISPKTDITIIKKDEKDQLTSFDIKTSITKKLTIDKAGNHKKMMMGMIEENKSISQLAVAPRQINFDYNPQQSLSETEHPEVLINDESKPAKMNSLPEKPEKILTKTIWNTQGKKLAEMNAAGNWSFSIYDNANRLVYEINTAGVITQYDYNNFDQHEKIVRYATPLNRDLSEFYQTGITESTMKFLLKQAGISSTDKGNRTQEITYYKNGKIESIKKDAIIYYSEGVSGVARPETRYEYSISGHCTCESKLVRPGVWAKQYTWYDACGNIIGELDANGYLTYFELYPSGKAFKKTEYANRITVEINLEEKIENLKKMVSLSEKDRVYEYGYDKLDQCTSEKLIGVSYQILQLDEKTKVPTLKTIKKDLTKSWEYTATGKIRKVTYEDDSFERKFYNECDIKIAETGVACERKDSDGNKYTIIPLTIYKPNAHGQMSVIQTSTQGAEVKDGEVVFPLSLKGKIIERITAHDNLGLPKMIQDAEKNSKGFTFTRTRKIAREIQDLTQWIQDEKKQLERTKHTDEKQYRFDKSDQINRVRTLRNNSIEEETHHKLNPFGEKVGEGADGDQWDFSAWADTQGHMWYTNGEQGHEIRITDLRGLETLHIQSAEDDLSQIKYEALNDLIKSDSKKLDRTETIRDAYGHVLSKKMPIWFRDQPKNPTISYQLDRWHNIIAERDANGNETQYEYNHRDQIIKRIQPEVDVVDTNDTQSIKDKKNQLVRKKLVTLYGYNERGFKIGWTNPRGFTYGWVRDASGLWLEKIFPDGTIEKRRVLNAANHLESFIDSQGKEFKYENNLLGSIISETRPGGDSRRFECNEAQDRISDIDDVEQLIRYAYDARHNINARYLPLGQSTIALSDRNHKMKQITNPDGDSYSSEMDYFGKIKKHTDIEGRVYEFLLNNKRQFRSQKQISGPTFKSMQMDMPVNYQPEDAKHEFPSFEFNPNIVDFCKPQELKFDYAFGLLQSVEDKALNRMTTIFNNNDGRPEEISITTLEQVPKLLYRIKTSRDELQREVQTRDMRLSTCGDYSTSCVDTKFDANSNRSYINVVIEPSGFSADCKAPRKEKNLLNTFDFADRVLISGGLRGPDGIIKISSLVGLQLGYTSGQRTSEESIDQNNCLQKAILQFYDDSTLEFSKCPDLKVRDEYEKGVYTSTSETNNGHTITRKIQVNKNNIQKNETVTDNNEKISFSEVIEKHPSGLPYKQKTQYFDKSNNVVQINEIIFGYLGTDSKTLNKVTGYGIKNNQKGPESTAEFCRDPNSFINGKIGSDDEPNEGGSPAAVAIESTYQGIVLKKQNMIDGSMRETNFLTNIYGELLAAYSSGYLDTNTNVIRPSLFFVFMTGSWADKFEKVLSRCKNQYSPHGILIQMGTAYGAAFYQDGKVIRNSDRTPIILKSVLTPEEYRKLPQGKQVDENRIIEVDRSRDKRHVDYLTKKILNLRGLNSAYYMQRCHHAYHQKNEGQDIKPDISDIAINDIIHPVGKLRPTEKNAKNNPLNWEDPFQLQQLGLQTYVVNFGDTFKSIAKRFGGDINDADRLARMNGFLLSGNAPKPGILLRVPQIIPSKNKFNTTRPDQDFLRIIAGSLSPKIVAQPITPQPLYIKRHSSWFKILVKVIALAIVCAAAPHLAGVAVSLFGGSFAITTGVFAAIGDAAVQGLAIGMGAQSKFSFAEMLETGVAVGVGTSLGQAKNVKTLVTNAMKVGTAAVSTQLVEMATGLRNKFDAAAVGLQVSSFVLSAKINDVVESNLAKYPAGSYVTKTIANEASGALLGKAIGNTPIDIHHLAMNAVGSSIGSEIGSKGGHRLTEMLGGNAKPVKMSRGEVALKQANIEIPKIGIDVDRDDIGAAAAEYLSDLSYRQRASRLDRWNSSSTNQASHHRAIYDMKHESLLDQIASSGVVRGINRIGEQIANSAIVRGINSVNPFVLGANGLNEAYHAYHNGDLLNAAAGVGLAAFSIFSTETALGANLFNLKKLNFYNLATHSRYSIYNISSGGRTIRNLRDLERFETEAKQFYESVRVTNTSHDIKKIAEKTGFQNFQIQRIKNHLFFNTHKLETGVRRFDPDIEIADSWRRLQTPRFHKQDVNLLKHEYFESRYESLYKTDYKTAHNAAINSGRIWHPEQINEEYNFIERSEKEWQFM